MVYGSRFLPFLFPQSYFDADTSNTVDSLDLLRSWEMEFDKCTSGTVRKGECPLGAMRDIAVGSTKAWVGAHGRRNFEEEMFRVLKILSLTEYDE